MTVTMMHDGVMFCVTLSDFFASNIYVKNDKSHAGRQELNPCMKINVTYKAALNCDSFTY